MPSLIALAASSLAETSTARADEIDRALMMQVAHHLHDGDGSWLTGADPRCSAVVGGGTAIWRRLLQAWRHALRAAEGEQLAATLFALPVVIVAGNQAPVAARSAAY